VLAEAEPGPIGPSLILVYLCKGETFAEIAAGFGSIPPRLAVRKRDRPPLADRAPKLRQAVRDAQKAGCAHVVVDGTLIPIDRVAVDRPFYSGKRKKHGMNLQVLSSPGENTLWV
jgi:hypothetical protein